MSAPWWKQEIPDLVHAVQAALREWDPVGVHPGDDWPADEYDAYAPHIVSLLAHGATAEELAKHLEHLRTMTMGCPANRDADTTCARKLVAWWKERSEQADRA